MSIKPSLPKGTRDIGPAAMLRREFILNHLKTIFKKYGFLPIETPAMENLQTLTGKYGEEGDRLIFKVLNSGDFLKKGNKEALAAENSSAYGKSISDKALRYDLTVPFARFVSQNQNEVAFPFKRYQIQPVWRADRPQKGRFREFYQCDADAIGSSSLWLELDFIRMYDEAFTALSVPVNIHFNNRKLLAAFAEALKIDDRLGEFTILLDKLDKIGIEGVIRELEKNNFEPAVGEALKTVLDKEGTNAQKLDQLEQLIANSPNGPKGLEEVRFVLDKLKALNLKNNLVLDLSLARGLDYYTGAIFEVKATNVEMGSIGGGGRYDDLTGIFGLKNISGMGISFGLDRIQLVMEELELFPDFKGNSTQVLFLNFGEEEALYSLKLVNALRDKNVKAELYPDASKMKKQLDFANKKQIPYTVMIGSNEIKEGSFAVKNMEDGNQQKLDEAALISFLENLKK